MRKVLKKRTRKRSLVVQPVPCGEPGRPQVGGRMLFLVALSVLLLQACEPEIDDTTQTADEPDDVSLSGASPPEAQGVLHPLGQDQAFG